MQHRLTERKKADREKMAREVETLAAKHGWQSSRCPHVPADTVRVELEGPRGLSVSIEFERNSGQLDIYCMPWHFTYSGDKDANLTDSFGRLMGSSVNPSHRRKCTTFARGIDTLLCKLEQGMELAASGDAFLPPAKYIMKNHAAYHPPGAWHYCLFTENWEKRANEVMMPEAAIALGLESVSPMQAYNAGAI